MNEWVFQAASVTLLAVCLRITAYSKRRAGIKKGWVPLDAGLFLTATLEVVFFSLVALVFLGAERLIFAFSLGSGLLWTLTGPVPGLSFITANLLVRPWELSAPNDLLLVLPRLLAVLCVFSFLVSKLRTGKWDIFFPLSARLIIVLFAWFIVSAIIPQIMFGQDANEALKQLFSFMLPPLAVVFLLMNTAADENDMALIRDTITIAVTGFVLASLVYAFSISGSAFLSMRLQGPGQWGNANDLASLIVFSLPFLASSYVSRKRGLLGKSLFFLTVLVLGSGLLLTQSRGGIIGASVAVAVWILSKGRGTARNLIIPAAILSALLLFKMIADQRSDEEESKMSRMNYAVAGIKMLKASPIFGVGFGNYEKLYGMYSELFIEEGMRTAHSSWVLVAAETGVPGLILFVSTFVVVLKKAWEMKKARPEYLSLVSGYGLTMSFLSHTYLFLPYLMFSLVAVAAKVQEAEKGGDS